MANVSYLRSHEDERQSRRGRGRGRADRPGAPQHHRGRYLVGGAVLVVLAMAVVGGIVFGTSKPSLSADPVALATIGMPAGGGTIQSVSAVTGPHARPVPVVVRGHQIFPKATVPAHESISLQVVVKRPGWISWLSGSHQKLNLTLTTPAASLRSPYVTVRNGQPVRLHFKAPIAAYDYGSSPKTLHRHTLAQPSDTISLPRTSVAGSVYLSAVPRTWETGRSRAVSWFPAGGAATVVAQPAPGQTIKSSSDITLTFSKPVSKVLGSHLPPVSPTTQGVWHSLNSHTIQFRPEGYGYGLGATVKVALPSGVRLIGGQQSGDDDGGSWTVPGGSTTRLQQMLAMLGYLPMNFKYAGGGVDQTPQAQEAAAVKPPAGKFSWRYPGTPSWLTHDWSPGSYGEVTKAAVMTFEDHNGMTADGVVGPSVWRALINAVIHGQRNGFGYTVVDVSEGSPETLTLWHSGKTVMSTPVNTGIPQAPTAQGTFAVYEHLPVTTMSGNNPDGSHYSDPGIPWVSYFNGGDALHGFIRGSYGSPQSLGCVEMPFATAGKVYPYTPIGTIVHVT